MGSMPSSAAAVGCYVTQQHTYVSQQRRASYTVTSSTYCLHRSRCVVGEMGYREQMSFVSTLSIVLADHRLRWAELSSLAPRVLKVDESRRPLVKREYTFGGDEGCDFHLDVSAVAAGRKTELMESPEQGRGGGRNTDGNRVCFAICKGKKGEAVMENRGDAPVFIDGEQLLRDESVPLSTSNEIAVLRRAHVIARYVDVRGEKRTDLQLDGYRVLNAIGEGGFSTVYEVMPTEDGCHFAVKKLKRSAAVPGMNDPEAIENEIDVLRRARHAHVIRLCHVIRYGVDETYLFFELARGGDLLRRLEERRPEELELKLIFFQVVTALAYLHRVGIVHRDVKLENVLLMSRDPHPLAKLTDFGLAHRRGSSTNRRLLNGTCSYMAPEHLRAVVNRRPLANGAKCDVWSVGAALYSASTGVNPFDCVDSLGAMDQLLAAGIPPMGRDSVGGELLQAFVLDCLQESAALRPDADQLLGHVWFTDGGDGFARLYNALMMRSKVRERRTSLGGGSGRRKSYNASPS